MLRIIGLKVVEEKLLGSVLFEFLVLSEMLKRRLGRVSIHAEELTGLHPFVPSDVTILIQIEHVESRVDASGELLENVRVRVRFSKLVSEILMKIEPFFYEQRSAVLRATHVFCLPKVTFPSLLASARIISWQSTFLALA